MFKNKKEETISIPAVYNFNYPEFKDKKEYRIEALKIASSILITNGWNRRTKKEFFEDLFEISDNIEEYLNNTNTTEMDKEVTQQQ